MGQLEHVWLVLNFNAYNDTLNLVNSLQQKVTNPKVVIVDNGSANDSFSTLSKKYLNEKNITVIKSNENLGFAKGNNLGYDYIMKHYPQVDFIHCTNSDIVIEQEGFINLVEKQYEKNKFFLLGPKVLTHGKSSSPISYFENEKSFIKHVKKQYVLTKIYSGIAFFFHKIMGNKLEETYQNINARKVRKKIAEDENLVPILSGCYLIFSKDYVNYYENLFEPITFLYSEEYIMTYRMMRDGKDQVIYNDDIEVIHMHAGSSKNNQKFKVECELNNLKAMKEFYNKEKK